MALNGRRSVQIEIKRNGDVFYELWMAKQQDIPKFTPTAVQKCEHLDGEDGAVGAIHFWNYFLDGKHCSVKSIIIDINEEKKSVAYKILEGDLLEHNKTFFVHIHVDPNGSHNRVTWTVEYEKLYPNAPDPDTLMDLYKKITKDIEGHQLDSE